MTSTELNINSPDEDIIDSINFGNESSFNLLVLKYQKKVYWTAKRMLLNHDDANDITQEVFIKLYKNLKNYRNESSLFTYIYRMTINFSLNHIKKSKSLKSKALYLDYNISENNYIENETIYDDNIRTKILIQAISTLPRQQRAVFNMRFYDSLSYNDISKILNKSIGTLKANYFHAIKKIEQFLISKRQDGFL